MQGIYRETFQWRKYYLTTSTLPSFSPLNQRLSQQHQQQSKAKAKAKAKQSNKKLPCFLIPHQPSKQANQPTTKKRQIARTKPKPKPLSFHHSSFIIHHKKSHHNNANHPHQTLATRFPQPTPLRLRRSFLSLIEDFGRVSIATTRTRTTTTTTTIRTARATRATITTGRENLI